MRGPKKPPPDTVDNVRGRIEQLKLHARQNARMLAREGADLERALAKKMRAIEPALQKLQRRLGRAQKNGDAPAPSPRKGGRKKTTAKRSKKADAPSKPVGDGGDLLATLDSL